MADFDVSDSPFMALHPQVEPLPKPEIEPLSPPQSDTPDVSNTLALLPLASYPSKQALFEAIQSWAKPRGYTFSISRSTRVKSGLQRLIYTCDHWPTVRPLVQGIHRTQTRGTGCLFSILAIKLSNSLG
jgi:hypothetical protein